MTARSRITMVALLAVVTLVAAPRAQALEKVRVGWCSRTIASANTPFAVATKMGWFKQEGIEVELVPLPGSTDCVKNVATGELPVAIPSIEPLAIGRPQGIKAKTFYTAYQANIYGIAVPVDSPIKTLADLKGKSIGVISMSSAGVIVARAMVQSVGLDPDRDVKIVVAGEGAQPAALLRAKQVDALSQFDTQYAMVENAGVKLREIEAKEIERFPSNGFMALEASFKTKRKELVGLARGYAKGTIFAINNPEAAVRILWEVYPQTKPVGKDEATALREGVNVLKARIPAWGLQKAGVTKWGENSEANYSAYLKFLLKEHVIKQMVPVKDLVTNELIPEINNFDAAKIAAEAKAYKYAK